MTSTAIAGRRPDGTWPAGTVPHLKGDHLTDTDVMDPFLPEELFHPSNGEWIGRGTRPDPTPDLWAQVWDMEWPPRETRHEHAHQWSKARFNFEATCFGIGVAMGSPRGSLAAFYCGIVALLWAQARWDRFQSAD